MMITRSSKVKAISLKDLFHIYIQAIILLYLIVLHFAYVELIEPKWNYAGYVYTNPELYELFIAWSLAILPSFFLKKLLDRPSIVVYWILYFSTIIPSIVIPIYVSGNTLNSILLISIPTSIAFSLVGISSSWKKFKFNVVKIEKDVFFISLILIYLAFFMYIYLVFGFKIDVVSFLSQEVYEKRSSAKELTESAGGLLGYVLSWQGHIINPTLIAFGLFKRKAPLVFLGIIGQVHIYSIDGSKNTFFSIFLLFGLYLLLNKSKNYSAKTIAFTFFIAVLLVSFIDYTFKDFEGALTTLFTRRVVVTPGLISFQFYDFFSVNPKANFGYSFLRYFVNYPYDRPPAQLIGLVFYGESTNANANLWADAYANFGYLGVFLFTFILMFVLWVYDNISSDLPLLFSTLCITVPAFSLSDGALFTGLLTNGILLVGILVYIFPRSVFDLKTNHEKLNSTSNLGAVRSRDRHKSEPKKAGRFRWP